LVLLVWDVVGGMPAFVLVAPVLAVVEDGAVELCVEAEVLGAVVLAEPLTPAVVLPMVAGPVVEAEVPGALAEVLAVVEAVPV
jgi:hypothetical protein